MSDRAPKILPRNLTARAARPVVGNPAITRPEDAVGNCYPGLEVDVRNLDRRFFPGLVFEFIARNDIDASYNDNVEYGARLAYVDHKRDPELRLDPDLAKTIDDNASTLDSGIWFLEWIEQDGKRLSMRGPREPDGPTLPLDGLYVWRLVRGLEPDKPVVIALVQREGSTPPVVLEGWRRRFTDRETGTISAAYQPGEMTQSLCSPWQHDFRDCACHYWAANRPDVVYAGPSEIDPRTATGANIARVRARPLVDWIRRDRELEATARETIPLNRPHQLDHYEMNRAWRTLNVVVGDHEIKDVYTPPTPVPAKPYDNAGELADALMTQLGPLEMTLALEYLYAMFSVRAEKDVAEPESMLRDDVVFVRHHLKLIAMSEMQHLRWVNQLLWQLQQYRRVPYLPVLDLITDIPDGRQGHRKRQLRLLEPKTLDDFIAVERPSGSTTGAYARVIATLKSPEYPEPLRQTAERIVNDGVDHATWLLDVKRVLAVYEKDQERYLHPIAPDTEAQAKRALDMFEEVKARLTTAYRNFADGRVDAGADGVANARRVMMALYAEGERLAKLGVGIPFWR
jgi:Ferritin-like